MRGIVSLILQHARSSTVHSLSYFGRAQGKIRRLFWILTSVVCVAICVWQFQKLIGRYLSYEKTTNLEVKHATLTFPSLTICSLNPFKNSEAIKIAELADLIEAYKSAVEPEMPLEKSNEEVPLEREKRSLRIITTICACEGELCIQNFQKRDKENKIKSSSVRTCVCAELVKNTWDCQVCDSGNCAYRLLTTTTQSTSTSTSSSTTSAVSESPYGFVQGSDSMATQSKAQESLTFISAELSTETKAVISFHANDIIKNCAFNMKSCYANSDFHAFDDFKYGRCFTFNHQSPSRFNSSNPGPLYGLRLMLFSNVSEYMVTTETAGTRIIIHEKDKYPFPDSFGYNTPAGTATAFSIREFKTSRMPSPYGDCLEETGQLEYLYPGKYTVEGCQRTCHQSQVVALCKCGDPRFPLPSRSRYCSYKSPIERDCLTSFKLEEGSCNCPVPCNETSYLITISTSKWPIGIDRVPGCLSINDTSDKCAERRRSGQLVEAYFEQLSTQYIWETPAYTSSNLASDLAGTTGFWIGMSFLGCVELIFLLYEIVAHVVSKIASKWHEKKMPPIPDFQLISIELPKLEYKKDTIIKVDKGVPDEEPQPDRRTPPLHTKDYWGLNRNDTVTPIVKKAPEKRLLNLDMALKDAFRPRTESGTSESTALSVSFSSEGSRGGVSIAKPPKNATVQPWRPP